MKSSFLSAKSKDTVSINRDSGFIMFSCGISSYKDVPGHPLRCSYDGSLKDLLVYNKPKGAKKIFYQQLSMNITELESKKQFKCTWVRFPFAYITVKLEAGAGNRALNSAYPCSI